MKVVLASQNRHKLEEMQNILGALGMEVMLERDAGVDMEVEETGTTFAENSLLKAQAVFDATGLATVADDSGLMVDALDGAPGVYSARYGGLHTDAERIALLLENMKDVPDDKRQAKFVCVITLVTPDGNSIQARGEVHGFVTHAPAGEGGFGYDPIFYYPPFGKTLAQVPQEEKNRVSHRAEALKIFYTKLKEAGYAEQ